LKTFHQNKLVHHPFHGDLNTYKHLPTKFLKNYKERIKDRKHDLQFINNQREDKASEGKY